MEKTTRIFFYFAGMLILSLGIILNTKSALGVSPIISIAYALSEIHGWNFGNTSFVMYAVLAIIEYAFKGKNFKLYDLLQIPLAILLTRIFNLFGAILPDVTNMPARVVCLVLGIALTGIGAAMNVNTRLVPNPGDGVVQAIADRLEKRMGNVKNVFDVLCVTLTFVMGMILTGHPIGVGLGTVAAVIGVGRFIYLYNSLFKEKQLRLTGVEN